MIQLVKGDSHWITEKIDWYSNFPLFSTRTLESWSIPRNNFSIRWCKNCLKIPRSRATYKKEKKEKRYFRNKLSNIPASQFKVTQLRYDIATRKRHDATSPYKTPHLFIAPFLRIERAALISIDRTFDFKIFELKKKKTEEEKIKKLIIDENRLKNLTPVLITRLDLALE